METIARHYGHSHSDRQHDLWLSSWLCWAIRGQEMITIIIGTAWWLSGFIPMVCINWRGLDKFTWGNLMQAVAFGFFGPMLGIAIIFTALTQRLLDAGFWDRPIFGKRQ